VAYSLVEVKCSTVEKLCKDLPAIEPVQEKQHEVAEFGGDELVGRVDLQDGVSKPLQSFGPTVPFSSSSVLLVQYFSG